MVGLYALAVTSILWSVGFFFYMSWINGLHYKQLSLQYTNYRSSIQNLALHL